MLVTLVVGLAAMVLARKWRATPAAASRHVALPGETLPHAQRAPAKKPGFSLRRLRAILIAVYNGINNDRVLAIAGGVAFFSLLALFPAIAAFVSLYGLFANPNTIQSELQQLSAVLPQGALQVISDQLTRVALQGHSTLGLTFAISVAISLWSANSGIKALIDALNVVRGQSEKRSFIKLNAISLAFTVGAIFFVSLAMGAVVVVPIVLHFIGFDQTAPLLLNSLRWPALFVATALALAVIYRYGPCRAPDWHLLSVGSFFAALAWLAASFLFSWYTAQFGNYNKTYGSLGAVIGFMTWLWISVIVILVGAELDCAIARTGREAKSDGTH